MKHKKLGIIILIILTIIVLYFLLKDNYKEIINAIVNANFLWLILAVILYAVYTILQAIPFYDFAKIYNKNVKFKSMIYIIIVTYFFNGITPLATGGQPLQVYELHKQGIKTVNASNIVIQNFIVFQIAIVLWSLIALLLNYSSHLLLISVSLRNLFLFGFIINVLLLGFVLIVCLSKNMIKKIIFFIISILHKLKIVKNMEKQEKKWEKTCVEFYDNFQLLYRNKYLLIKNVVVLVIGLTAYYSVPICVIYALHLTNSVPYIASLVIGSFVFISSCFLPIPGATGGIEYSFLGFLGHYIKGFKLNATLILWRFITYYLPTIIGGIVFTISKIKKQKGINN